MKKINVLFLLLTAAALLLYSCGENGAPGPKALLVQLAPTVQPAPQAQLVQPAQPVLPM